MKPIYKRILLKLSGEVLQGKYKFGIDVKILNRITQEIKELIDLDVQVAIVIGGGNLFRGINLAKEGMSRIVGDHMGMLATIMNGLAIRDSLYRNSINTNLMSAIPINGICDHYNWMQAVNLLKNNHVILLVSGTGNPFFTTDSAACLRSIEINANIVLKATKVDGVFSSDPIKYPKDAKLYDHLTYQDVLIYEFKVMDLSAFTLARDHNLPIRIFNINKPGALRRIIMGEKEGTLISK